jgi:ubiquinone/menaquinone biosynthesis C-methylase UbiE
MKQSTSYDDFAQKYSESFLKDNTKSIAQYFMHVDFDLKEKKLLDLGCGDGYDLHRFGQLGALLYGVDASQEMVALAKKNTSAQAEIKQGYFEEIPFADNFFDVVVSKWALQAADNIQSIYQEVHRVLKPRGTFLYLASHPLYQFLEKRNHPKDYFQKEMVEVKLFEGKIIIREPTHTLNEYLSAYFFQHFDLQAYEEGFDDSVEKIQGDTYPIFFILKSVKK